LSDIFVFLAITQHLDLPEVNSLMVLDGSARTSSTLRAGIPAQAGIRSGWEMKRSPPAMICRAGKNAGSATHSPTSLYNNRWRRIWSSFAFRD